MNHTRLLSTALATVSLLGFGLVAPGCADEGQSVASQTDDSTAAGPPLATAKPTSDAQTELSVRAGTLTLTLNTALTWKAGASSPTLVMHGTTSKNLVSLYGFIPDDGFGTSSTPGPRTFELAWDNASDINTVLSGNPFYLEITTTSAAGQEDWTAQVFVGERLLNSTGSSRIAFEPDVLPIYVSTNNDGVVFRGHVTTTSAPESINVTSGGAAPTLTATSTPNRWQLDWPFEGFEPAAVSTTPVTAKAKFEKSTSTETAKLGVHINVVSLSTSGGSPDDIFGLPSCDARVQQCLSLLPATTTDFEACGEYFPVSVCINQLGFPTPPPSGN